MESKSRSIYEAEQIGHYLLSTAIRDSEKNTYADAMEKLNISFSNYETALWESMLKSKWRMASIDAALALKDPNNNTRRKLFTMLAILEASPNYTTYFFSRKFSFLYVFKIAAVGTRAVCRAIVGILIIKSIKRKCK